MSRTVSRHASDVGAVVAWAAKLPASAGGTRVVAIEGRSGSGKTELAGGVASALGAPLVRMDDLYPGWDGLRGGVIALTEWVLAPLAGGGQARWRRWDWAASRYAEWHETPRGDWLVVEGVGCGAAAVRPYLSGLVWLEAPVDQRRARALARDGEMYAPHWERWARQEDDFYGTDDVRAHAGLIIDTAETAPSQPA
ncbi:nucleoside/nucleotide kinase family protein [Paractinoplanes deccanensis]|uniref:dephospho-CoA kinase n=1 Tax=Paractinoplanes deccanensis TaxID=113561 RepID=UPI001944015C|nr:dephospho-CoA kinase [Actinoplanes deccanensis]